MLCKRGLIRLRLHDMDGGWALVLSAVVTAVGGILVTVITLFRKENKEDHDIVAGMLRHVFDSVKRVEVKVDKVSNGLEKHIEKHQK